MNTETTTHPLQPLMKVLAQVLKTGPTISRKSLMTACKDLGHDADYAYTALRVKNARVSTGFYDVTLMTLGVEAVIQKHTTKQTTKTAVVKTPKATKTPKAAKTVKTRKTATKAVVFESETETHAANAPVDSGGIVAYTQDDVDEELKNLAGYEATDLNA